MGSLIVITATAFLVMILEFVFLRGNRRWLTLISMLGTVVAMVPALTYFTAQPKSGLYVLLWDGMASTFTLLILISAFLVLLFSYSYTKHKPLFAEHTYLILFAVAGAITMATAVELVSLYIGLELLSVASYVLVAIRTKSIRSVEGGVKYLIMGSIGSAVALYGMSFLYGISSTTNLVSIGQMGGQLWQQYPVVVVLSFVLILAGMGVKLSLVPFHMWTPDAYDGAPSPVSAFIATLSKTAAFVMLLRIVMFAFNGAAIHVFFWAGILAAITMVVGNLLALTQHNMKRLLAFSSVAQAGYVLVPFAMFGSSTYLDWTGLFDSIAFYLFAYTFMTIGAFAVVSVISRVKGTTDDEALVGLYRRSPWLAVMLTVYVLSLAGMPLTAGFLGKFYIFTDTLHLHMVWLGILLFLTSVMSFYYYFGWIKKIFSSPETRLDFGPIRSGSSMNILLGLCALGTLVLGVVPPVLLHPLVLVHWF